MPDCRAWLKQGEKLVDKIVIQGGKPLFGDVQISGAKNAALPILLQHSWPRAKHFHNIRSYGYQTIKKLLKVWVCKLMEMKLAGKRWKDYSCDAPYDWSKPCAHRCWCWDRWLPVWASRAFLFPAAALSAQGRLICTSSLTGHGGARRIKQRIYWSEGQKLKGADIYFDIQTVPERKCHDAATLAEGTTVLNNAAREPKLSIWRMF